MEIHFRCCRCGVSNKASPPISDTDPGPTASVKQVHARQGRAQRLHLRLQHLADLPLHNHTPEKFLVAPLEDASLGLLQLQMAPAMVGAKSLRPGLCC